MDELVWTLSVAVPLFVPSNVTEFGVMVQPELGGQPVDDNPIVWLNCPRGASVIVELPAEPLAIVREVGAAETVKSGPDPARDTDCGLPVALSLNVSVAVCFP